jgi:1-deoxy-D-xylulose-5-phosphate synthase
VTCSAGMAMGGLHPVVPIYSTFVNRAFDQILLDCGLHDCAVTFVLDRGGITGDDGPSHNGMWDLSTLQVVPNIRIAAPRDACTLRRELREAVDWSGGPTVVRFPKGPVTPSMQAVDHHDGIDVLAGLALPHHRRDVLIIAIGSMAEACLDAARLLSEHGITSTVVDPCWVAPLNPALREMAARHRVVVSVEDNVRRGGVGSALLALLNDQDTSPPPVANVAIAAEFIPHGSRDEILTRMGLTGPGIAATAYDLLCRTFSERDCYGAWRAQSRQIDSEHGPTVEEDF